jgi:hypothetical protein
MLKLPKRFSFPQPKIKPTGPVEIDYSVAPSGSKVWFYPDREMSGGTFTKHGDALYINDYFNFGGTGDYLDCGGSYDFMADETFTLVTVCSDFNLGYSSQSLCGYGATSSTQGWTLRYDQYATTNRVGFTKFGIADGATTITCPTSERVVIAVTFSGTNVIVAVNGVVQTITMGNLNAPTTGSKFVIGGAWRTGAFISEGIFKCHMVAAMPGVVSAQRLLELSNNPYQILKPANDVYYFPSAASGAYTLTAEPGVYSLGSDPVNLTYAEILTAEPGVFTLGSDDVNLTLTPAGAYTLTADAGVFSLGSDPVNLLLSEVLVTDPCVYSLGSDAVNLTYTPVSTISAEPGVFTLGSDAINLTYAEILTAEAGVYTLGSDAVNLVLGILETPNCYTWLTSTITDVEWYSSLIDASPTYVVSTINGDPSYVVSTIDGDDLYLIGDLC